MPSSSPNHESSLMLAVLAMRVDSIKSELESSIFDFISLMPSRGFRTVEESSSKPGMGQIGFYYISWYGNKPVMSLCFSIVKLVLSQLGIFQFMPGQYARNSSAQTLTP